ncbi:MAG: RCC1 domain-containing protein [Sandaracinaceae bacterium]
MRALASLGLFVSLGASLAACDPKPGALGLQCERNSECATPLVCRLARCRRECRSGRDCPIGAVCVRDESGIGACRLDDEATCALDSECAAPLRCINAACTEECAVDSDCTSGASCVGEPGARGCVDNATAECFQSSDCGAGLRCAVDGRCRPPCREARDCDFGQVCVDGDCVVRPRDAGVGLDGGAADAGGADAATADAGTSDGGISDAGVPCTMGSDCTAPHVTSAACPAGACVIAACESGYDDCDGDFTTGCELAVVSDPDNCGGCGNDCGAIGTCRSGTCDVVTAVGVGAAHLCVGRSDNQLTCIGSNDYGELARGMVSADATTFGPVATSTLSSAPAVLELGAAITCTIGMGDPFYTCAGNDTYGQIGNGSFASAVTSLSAAFTTGTGTFVSVSAGGDYVRDGSGAPTRVVEIGGACGLDDTSAVWCAGSQLLRGDGGSGNTAMPLEVPGLSAMDVSVGHRHVCAVRTDHTVVCWGAGGAWLGPNGPTDQPTPVVVPGISDATHVSAGRTHTCVRRMTGNVSCWGEGPLGQLGASVSGGTSATPVGVASITDAIDVEVDERVSCALRTGGRVSCWGANDDGELGDGTTGAGGFMPVEAMGLTDATSLSVGYRRACVLRANGAVACWGGHGTDYGSTDPSAWTVPTDHPEFPATP